MTNTLLSISAAAGLIIGAAATAHAAPIGGSAMHVNAGIVQTVHGDGDRGWGGDYGWRHRHNDWNDWRPWHRSWWRRHHGGDHERRGDRDYDRGGHRDGGRRDWR